MVSYPSAQICASNPKWKWRPNFRTTKDRSGDPRGGDEAGVIAGPPPCPDCSRLCLSQEGGKSLGSSENCYTAQGIGLCALSINLMSPWQQIPSILLQFRHQFFLLQIHT